MTSKIRNLNTFEEVKKYINNLPQDRNGFVSLTFEDALAIVEHPEYEFIDHHIQDWARNTIALRLDKEAA